MANLTGKATVEGEGDFQVQEFNFKLKKVDRTWVIYRIDTVETLSQATRRNGRSRLLLRGGGELSGGTLAGGSEIAG